MTKEEVKLVFVDAQYILRRNFSIQKKGDIYEDGLLRSFFGSMRKCQEFFKNAKLILLFDKKYYDESTGRRYYFTAKDIPEYKSDRVYVTQEDVDRMKEKLKDPNLDEKTKEKIVLELVRLEKEAKDMRVFNFSKSRIVRKSGIDSKVNKYNIQYQSYEYPGLEADSLIWFLSQKSFELGIPSAIYSIDSDLVCNTNDCTAFVVPVGTKDSIKLNRSVYLKEIKARANDNNITRHEAGVFSELYWGGHNAIQGYINEEKNPVDFSEFVKLIKSEDNSEIISTYRKYYNSLMLNDFDKSIIKNMIDEVYDLNRELEL